MKNKSAKIPACQLFFSQTWNFLNVYLVKQAGRSQATAESYRDSLTIFKNYLVGESGKSISTFRFSDCTKECIYNFREYLLANGSQPSTVNVRVAAIRAYLNYASDMDISIQSVALAVSQISPCKTIKKEKPVLSDGALAAILSAPPNTKFGVRDRAILILLYDTAVRISELLNIRLCDVAMESKYPNIFITGKGNKERTMTQSIDQLHLLILNVGLAIHNTDWNWRNVNSPFTRLYYVTEGAARILLPTGIQELKPDHLYLVPSFTTHSYLCDTHFVHYYLHIYEDHQSESSILEDFSFPTEIPAGDLELPLIKRLCGINPTMQLPQSDPTSYDNNPTLIKNIIKNKQRTFCDKVESRGIVYQLMARFLKDAQPKAEINDDRIQKVLSYIRKNIYKTIDIDSLAAISCLSKDHFIRLFKKEVNNTPLQYINQKKIEKAQLILITDSMPVKNISYLLAYEDHSYFNRLFKKLTGVTPQQYRDRYKK